MARPVKRPAKRPADRQDESGYSLIELIVAMSLFSVFLAMFIAGIVAITRVTTEARVDAQTSSSVGVAMQRIERSVRYADSVNYAGSVGNNSYVEWRTDKQSTVDGIETCTQLRYSEVDGTIAMRSWQSGTAPSATAWNVLVKSIRGEATNAYPFATVPAIVGVSNYQGLTVHTVAGLSETAGTDATTTVYAKNSTVNSPSNLTNAGGQSITPVCMGTGVRP